MIEVQDITINYQKNPVGIEKIENIGWKIISDKKNIYQNSYELEVSEDISFKKKIYSSGKVFTKNSTHIEGKEINKVIRSSCKYFIRVRVATEQEESTWCVGSFVVALLNVKEWKAEFITIDEVDGQMSRGSYLRKSIYLERSIKNAYVYTTALGLYHFYINGEKVGEDEFTPGWTSYNKQLLYQTYDVTQYLKQGENTLAAMVGAGWYKGDVGPARVRNHYGKQNAFACQLVVELQSGEVMRFISGEDWRGNRGPLVFSEIYDGEIYDARLEMDNWNTNEFDDGDWKRVSVVPVDVHILTAQSGAKVREIERVSAKKIFKTPQGDTVIDFGQNLTGWIEFKVKGKRDDKVELNCFEILDARGNVYKENLRSAKERIVYICKDEEYHIFHEHFSYQGFRYVQVSSYPDKLNLENFTACVIHSQMKPTGFFECSEPDVNQLHHNVLWGMKGNFLDVPTDCPQRDERLGWTGDAQIFCRTATYLMDTYTFYCKWLKDMSLDQVKEGGIPHVIPDILNGKRSLEGEVRYDEHSSSGWADAVIIIPWTLYQMYGDLTIIKKQYKSMKRWIEFMRHRSEGCLWNFGRQLGDWLALDAAEGSFYGATPLEFTCASYYVYSVSLFAKMAKAIGKVQEADEYEKLYEIIKKDYQERFWNKGRLKVQTQTAHIISLYFDLVAEQDKEKTIEGLLKLLIEQKGHLTTGFIGTPYFCHVLSQNGHSNEAYELLLKDDFPSWLYQIKQGATTVWEHWDGIKSDGTMWSAEMNSFNHYAYGAVADWLYGCIIGIQPLEEHPGFEEFIIEPHIGKRLKYAKGSYECIYGRIYSEWKKSENIVEFDIEIPCNTTVHIQLYDAREIIQNDNLSFEKGNVFRTVAGSGKYKIIYKI